MNGPLQTLVMTFVPHKGISFTIWDLELNADKLWWTTALIYVNNVFFNWTGTLNRGTYLICTLIFILDASLHFQNSLYFTSTAVMGTSWIEFYAALQFYTLKHSIFSLLVHMWLAPSQWESSLYSTHSLLLLKNTPEKFTTLHCQK